MNLHILKPVTHEALISVSDIEDYQIIRSSGENPLWILSIEYYDENTDDTAKDMTTLRDAAHEDAEEDLVIITESYNRIQIFSSGTEQENIQKVLQEYFRRDLSEKQLDFPYKPEGEI